MAGGTSLGRGSIADKQKEVHENELQRICQEGWAARGFEEGGQNSDERLFVDLSLPTGKISVPSTYHLV